MKIKISDTQIIKDFLFTVDEYKRFTKYFPKRQSLDLLEDYTEEEYIGVQTKLMILRKYSYNRELVYLPKLIEISKKMFADIEVQLRGIETAYNDIEANQLQAVLSDGNKLALFELQECVVYGVYLHADDDKIQKLLKSNEPLLFSMTRKFVEDMETVVLELYDLLSEKISERYERKQPEKAPVIYAGEIERAKQEITGSPFWGNLYGKDASDEDILNLAKESSIEDMLILSMCLAFFSELKKTESSIEVLEKFIFPPTRRNWGDFSELKEAYRKEWSEMGWSSRVRYNDRHDMAYVHLYPNVKEAFIFDQPHVVTGLTVITLVKDNEKYGWRIFAVGEKIDEYKEEISPTEWVKRILKKRWIRKKKK